ncbi:hypothetical protein RSSM_03055 [Rhodopirellula sallentina SM41]|uniref:Uncharacterized protein n=1 Tax=Rhodopirellula sallentina SM41 TaxID=1263870 RepID=M5UCA7_9BACT|nr:hypothetical protein RSSM_03055 [Rhodopirellula sallentina SM41]
MQRQKRGNQTKAKTRQQSHRHQSALSRGNKQQKLPTKLLSAGISLIVIDCRQGEANPLDILCE